MGSGVGNHHSLPTSCQVSVWILLHFSLALLHTQLTSPLPQASLASLSTYLEGSQEATP
jgi:hypothetical protein